jgi:hypothetical protein
MTLGTTRFSRWPFDFIYCGPTHDIAAWNRYMYADDTHIYAYTTFHLSQYTTDEPRCRIEACIAYIKVGMKENNLQLNVDKTELSC